MAIRLRDDRDRLIALPAPPRRIVSLVPSDTLNVCALGAAGALVGRTDYCELPKSAVEQLPSIGGTKNPRLDAILDLSPDLVLANQEENSRGDLEQLAQRGVRVYVSFPKRVAEGLAHLARLARILGVASDGAVKLLLGRGYDALREAEAARAAKQPLRVFCPIWMDPLMTVHGSTFISDMLDLAGAQNVFADRERRYPLAADLGRAPPLSKEKVGDRDVRYPRVTLEEVTARQPELVLLPDEPHPFNEEDARVFAALPIPAAKRGAIGGRAGSTPALCPSSIVHVSGKDLCWYGARSVEGIPRVCALVEHGVRVARELSF